jgi:DNA-directed RNA polymerase
MLTVTMAAGEGMEHFAAIHDSYGCLAGDMELLARLTRQAFVALYTQHDVVDELRACFQRQTEEPLPAPPPSGSLDVAGVLASDYFFS